MTNKKKRKHTKPSIAPVSLPSKTLSQPSSLAKLRELALFEVVQPGIRYTCNGFPLVVKPSTISTAGSGLFAGELAATLVAHGSVRASMVVCVHGSVRASWCPQQPCLVVCVHGSVRACMVVCVHGSVRAW